MNPSANTNDAEVLARRLAAFELRKQGHSFRAIGTRLGVSHQTVQNDVKKMLDEYLMPAVDSYRKQQLAEIDDTLLRLYAIRDEPQYITNNAGLVRGPDNKPLRDMEHLLKVEDRILKQWDMRAKLLGTYAATQSEVTVETVDSTDLEIRKLVDRQKARNALDYQALDANTDSDA
jgi:hypothetical protein